MTTRVDRETHRRLRVRAAERGMTLTSFISVALRELVASAPN